MGPAGKASPAESGCAPVFWRLGPSASATVHAFDGPLARQHACPRMDASDTPPCILVADDDDGNRELLERLLGTRSFRVMLAPDGEVALHLAQSPAVDLVLLDQMMPGLTGTQVLQRLRAMGNDVPVIMLTAVGVASEIAEALRLGADDYVTKPFSPTVLLARVERRLRPRPALRKPDTPAPQLPFRTELRAEGAPGAFTSFLGRLLRGKRGAESTDPVEELPLGTVLSRRYRLKSMAGSGAFGVVYCAQHMDLEQDVAVKVLRRDAAPVEQGVSSLETFRREAVRACRVRHPNAVRVSDFGVTEGRRPYLVMDLLHGESLEDRILRNPLPARTAALIISDLLSALAAAHDQGVIHHDVKASNVFLHVEHGVEVPKLIDFGAGGDVGSGPPGMVVGTASHMAPERFLGAISDPRSDVYAAGVTLYDAVVGALPYAGQTYEELQRMHEAGGYCSASFLRTDLSPEWDVVLARLMALDPAQRPLAREAAELVRRLG